MLRSVFSFVFCQTLPSEEGKWQTGGAHTFAAGDSGAPDDIPILQDAGDGLWALGFDKAVITVEGDRAPQQEPVTKAPSIYRDARVVALVLTKCWKEKKNIGVKKKKKQTLEY